IDLTLGFNGLTYRFLYDTIPVSRALRIPALAVVLVGFSLAVLAGFGAARLLPRIATARARTAAAAALCAGTVIECLSIPMQQTMIPREPPAIYAELLRDHGSGPPSTIVEVPMLFALDRGYQDPVYMYYSTFHWQKLVNGYSGFFPPSYQHLTAVMRTFPDARSIAALREHGVQYAVVHGERMASDAYQRVITAMDACRCGFR